MHSRAFGIASTLVGASLWGFSGTCSQFLLSNYAISSLFITMVRMLGAGVLFLVLIVVRNRAALSQIARDQWAVRRFLLFGMAGLYLCQVTYVIAIGYTNAGTATVLQSLNIVMIMLATCVSARRMPRAAELAGLLFALAATVLIATQGDLGSMAITGQGLFWGLATAAAAAVYSMLPQPLHTRWPSYVVVGLGMLTGGAAACAVWALAFAVPGIDQVANGANPHGSALVPSLDVMGVAALAVVVIVGTFAAFYLFLHGLSIVGVTQGSQLGAIEPVSATVCSAVLMGTAFSIPDWVGLVLMVGTILLVAASSGQQSRESDA